MFSVNQRDITGDRMVAVAERDCVCAELQTPVASPSPAKLNAKRPCIAGSLAYKYSLALSPLPLLVHPSLAVGQKHP
jgi:hypothetical protein